MANNRAPACVVGVEFIDMHVSVYVYVGYPSQRAQYCNSITVPYYNVHLLGFSLTVSPPQATESCRLSMCG